MKRKSEGKCYFCGRVLGKTGVKRHLEKCKAREEEIKNGNQLYYWILVQGYDNKEYWMYLDASANATLRDLDEFLRRKWLECCGHLSMFEIDGEIFDSDCDPDPLFETHSSMDVKLKEVLYEGLEFTHEYDFGSTTVLKLKVVSVKKAATREEKIVLMARNLPLEYVCVECGKPATQLCAQCIYNRNAFYCDGCGKEHGCGEEMMLLVVNSPRMGVCGYCGEYDDDEEL